MKTREKMLDSFYNTYDENERLTKSRQGQLEYATTMHFVRRYLKPNSKILEIGAGTGRYSISLAKENFDVTAVELVENNLKILRKNGKSLKNLKSFQGDAVDLSRFDDNTFDLTLVFGPFYHLYDRNEINKAIDEAIRVTKPNGVIMCAFISIYAIMDTNYMYGRWNEGLKENFDDKYNILHFEEQLFTGYDISEFENLFKDKNLEHIDTIGVDGLLEAIEKREDFSFTDEQFESYVKYQINFANKRELLGRNCHLVYICKKY